MRGLHQAIVRFLWILMCMTHPPFIPVIHPSLHHWVRCLRHLDPKSASVFESLQLQGVILAIVVYAKKGNNSSFTQIVSSLFGVYSIIQKELWNRHNYIIEDIAIEARIVHEWLGCLVRIWTSE